jgi:hypothetical protein
LTTYLSFLSTARNSSEFKIHDFAAIFEPVEILVVLRGHPENYLQDKYDSRQFQEVSFVNNNIYFK